MKNMLKNNSGFRLPAMLLLMCVAAYASTQNLPWEGPLDTIKSSLTGPVAGAISLIGVLGAGAALIWGGEMQGFLKTIIMLILVISLIIAGNFVISMFTSTGAVI